MNRIPRPVAIAGVVTVAAFVVGVPLVAHHHGGTAAGMSTTSPFAAPPASTILPSSQPSEVTDDDPTGTAAQTASPERTAAVQHAALAFARTELDTHRSAAEWRATVVTLCTPELAASFAAADPPNSTATVNTDGGIPVSWLAPMLAEADVDITMDGAPRTLTVTLNGATGTWLVSDVDLSQS